MSANKKLLVFGLGTVKQLMAITVQLETHPYVNEAICISRA